VHAVDVLRADYRVVCLFFNPNIQPREEFLLRLQAVTAVCRTSGTPLWVPAYRPDRWREAVRGLEGEPEGGERCRVCFRQRLETTIQAAREAGIPSVTTTLTVGPRKNSRLIHEIGTALSARYGVAFLPYDFKKRDGFKQSVEKSARLGLYRQKWCGCEYSRRSRQDAQPSGNGRP
jgi:predicted adenine nucleotide alpha hydrolase (AANH) superfamily ATPase